MAKAKLHTGEVLEFDDTLSDDEIDAAVASYLQRHEVWKMLVAEIRGVKEAVVEGNKAIVEATSFPRVTTLETNGEGKPTKSVTRVFPETTIFN